MTIDYPHLPGGVSFVSNVQAKLEQLDTIAREEMGLEGVHHITDHNSYMQAPIEVRRRLEAFDARDMRIKFEIGKMLVMAEEMLMEEHLNELDAVLFPKDETRWSELRGCVGYASWVGGPDIIASA